MILAVTSRLSGAWSRPVRSAWGLASLALVVPLLPSAILFIASLVLAGDRPVSGPLGVVGPAIPVYLVLLPLLPFAIRSQRRGWRPRLGPLLLGVVGLGAALDGLLYLGSSLGSWLSS